jgi:DNA repair protein RecO (recombination protein O)
MHNIFVTEGVVLQKQERGEASTRVAVLTRERGLLRATARSARLERSKLRYGLEPLTMARFSFIQGRREWRLVGVEEVRRACCAKDPYALPASARIARLLLRLTPQGEPSQVLYGTIAEGFAALRGPHAAEVEIVVVLRILSHLGYLPESPALAPFIEGDFTIELSARTLASRALLIRTINESLQASGL